MKTNAYLFAEWRSKNVGRLILQLTAFTFVIQLFLSSRLWLTDRSFPLAPLIHFPTIGSLFDYLLPVALICCLVLSIFIQRQFLYLLIVGLLSLLIALDLNRLQPWVYLYLVIFISGIIQDFLSNKKFIPGIVQLIILSAFFWSGVSKLNVHFLEGTYLTIMQQVFEIVDLNFLKKHAFIGLFFPMIQILAVLFLLFQKTRKYGLILVVLSHLFIIYFVSPWGINNDFIVIPWNILMIFLAMLVFTPKSDLWFKQKATINTRLNYSLFILFLSILPILNLFGHWDDFLSFSLYSDKTSRMMIIFKDSEIPYLPNDLSQQLAELPGVEGGKMLNLAAWSFQDMGVPYYPSTKVLRCVQEHFCTQEIPSEAIAFLLYQGNPGNGSMVYYSCTEPLR